jgi:hypothetical protein
MGRLSALIVLALLLSGCTNHVAPPADPLDPATVYLTDYGRHASVLLPVSSGGYDEYAFGDWEFFAMGHARWWIGLRALVLSPQATLGRRHVDIDEKTGNIKQEIRPSRIMSFQVPRQRAESLAAELDARFLRASGQPMLSEYSGLYHVRDPGCYCLLHNCNQETADWLRQLGCRVDGSTINSKFVIRPAKSTG